jgi:thioredoxin-like negative regulator of GroEL
MTNVLYFTAPWCQACGGLKPHIIAVCKDMNVKLEMVDVSTFDGETIGMRYNVCGLPTVVVLSNGEMIGRIDSGVTRQGVIDLIKSARED